MGEVLDTLGARGIENGLCAKQLVLDSCCGGSLPCLFGDISTGIGQVCQTLVVGLFALSQDDLYHV